MRSSSGTSEGEVPRGEDVLNRNYFGKLNKESILKGPFALRLLTAAVIIIVTYGAMHALKAGIRPPEVVFPQWTVKDLPLQLGLWSGQKTELDPKIFDATEAKIAEDRNYVDDAGHIISIHLAMYDDVDAGVWHCPTNCYRCNGWQCRQDAKEPLSVEQTPAPQVYFTQWDHEGTQCMVVHWYQLGDTILYDRMGLGMARVALRGRATWPQLIKILIPNQPNATAEEDNERLLDFSKQIYLWLNDPARASASPAGKLEKPAPAKSNAAEEPKTSAKAKK
jgi:EpsI family protein